MSTFIFKNYWLFPQSIFATANQAKSTEKGLHTESGFAVEII